MNLFQRQLPSEFKVGPHSKGVPVWFMRQAGRYHQHYQEIRRQSDFMTMCKNPQMAYEITMGPLQEFQFDAAILFSDLLFPLEILGMGLDYLSGPPRLAFQLKTLADVDKLQLISSPREFFRFQQQALRLLREKLQEEKTLLGFVGAPFTLYAYAVEGSHQGNLVSSKLGLYDGRYQAFIQHLYPVLLENMLMQAEGGAQVMCLFDTAAGELALEDYRQFVVPELLRLCVAFKKQFPQCKLTYYSKHTQLHYLREIHRAQVPFDILGVDWRFDLLQTLQEFSEHYYIQGNIDPSWLHLPWPILEKKLQDLWQKISTATAPQINLDHWIMGLGHGVLPQTPQENVQRCVEYIHRHFQY